MWKKDETPKTPPARGAETPEKPRPVRSGSGSSTIGQSLKISGEVTGSEDLIVQGSIDGEIKLPENTVTIGEDGRVKARVEARVIVVEGTVEGDLYGGEQVEILQQGNVNGNIVSPRVGLEDGAQFKGNIDMSPRTSASKGSATPASTQPAAKGQPSAPTKEKNESPSGTSSHPKLSG